MNRRQRVADQLAVAMLAGPCDVDGYIAAGARLFGRRPRWLPLLCRRVFHAFGTSLEPRDRARLAAWIAQDPAYCDAWLASRPPRVVRYMLEPPRMSPRRGLLATCTLPDLPTTGDLAAWLGLGVGELDWFADARGMNPPEGPLAHYRYRWAPKSYGLRLVEAPKVRLREVQRRILRGILDPVPAHPAAHGFRRGHSCRTFVAPHVGRHVVLRMDLSNFFPGIPAPRIHALFDALGYPEAVARTLTALCTNAVPMSVARRGAPTWLDAKRLGAPHLPQGAPTSPALANLCALHLDLRVDALARSLDGQYTRYADDLALSGGETLRRDLSAVSTLVAKIAIEEGFAVNHRKTRGMHRGDRQVLTGIVVNEKPNVPRADFDRLKAVLTNCVRTGPASQNRAGVRDFEAHLAGRVAHVASLNRERGRKLAELLGRVDWRQAPVGPGASPRSP